MSFGNDQLDPFSDGALSASALRALADRACSGFTVGGGHGVFNPAGSVVLPESAALALRGWSFFTESSTGIADHENVTKIVSAVDNPAIGVSGGCVAWWDSGSVPGQIQIGIKYASATIAGIVSQYPQEFMGLKTFLDGLEGDLLSGTIDGGTS